MNQLNMLTPFVRHANEAELEDTGALDEATGPEMTTSSHTLWSDGTQEVGIWECTPGRRGGASRPTSSSMWSPVA